ncbi:Ig-like domain-containing protein [Pontibacter diazotrophicus]|uniref:Ig-like domain-containing protein n=1 Tax=Pontibacter diazotrophicus TaxID=1400979 RepID=UPI0015F18F2E|nr:Ig-like domain-containing protein [Pontibacter diazotrophicus]
MAAPQVQAKQSLAGAITISWSPVANATGYVLEKSNTGEAGSFKELESFSASDHSFRNTGLYYSQKVYYRMKAVADGEESAYSQVVSATTHEQGYTYIIMPLGDSNTEGDGGALPEVERIGYRKELYRQLVLDGRSEGYAVDFVGSQRMGGAHAEAFRLNNGFELDIDHAGFGGARDEDIVRLLADGEFDFYNTGVMRGPGGGPYLDKYSPDIILLHIGTNWVDGSESAMNDVKNLLDQVDLYEARAGKEVTVIVAKIIRRVCYTDADGNRQCNTPTETENTLKYNSMLDGYVKERIAAGDRLELVDMQDGAGIDYRYTFHGGDMADYLHPAQEGYDKMAPVWFGVLQQLLEMQAETAPDTQAPETSIAAKPLEISNNSVASFGFSSNEGGAGYEVSIDGAAFSAASTPYSIELADGIHTLQVRAKDEAGNTDSTPAAFTWTIDTQAPDAPVVAGPASGAFLNIAKPVISGTAEAGSEVSITVNGTAIGTVTAASNGAWSLIPTAALAEGRHRVTAKATDAAGNSSPNSTTTSFTIDTQAPETEIASGPAATSGSGEATFNFKSNEAGVKFLVSLNGAAFTEAASHYTLQGLADGPQILAVRAIDAAGNTDATPATYSWTIDTQAPAAPSITGITEDRGPFAHDYITSDNTLKLFGEAEANADLTLFEKGIIVGKVKVTGTGSWEFNYTNEALAQGAYRFTAAATDAAGNTGTVSADFVVQVDLTAPTVRLSTTSNSTVKEAFSISIMFSEEVYGISADGFSVTNGTLSNLASSDKSTYTATVTPTNDGAVRVSLAAGKVMDIAGNTNEASDVLEVEYDVTQPKVVLASDAPATVNAPFIVSFTFSEAVTGLQLEDITLDNGTASDFTKVNASLYKVSITPSADGEVSVRVPADKAFDGAENGNETSATLTRKYDVQRPAVVLHSDAPDPTNAAFTIRIRFSEEVRGFGKDNLSVTNGVASQLNKVDDLTYTVLITPGEGGAVAARVAANAVQDLAANGNEASNELTLVYDAGLPAVSISTTAPEKTNEAFTVVFHFSEAVSGFELSDIALTNAVAENLTRISDQQYTAVIRPAQDGMVVTAVPENKVQDAASNGNTASNRLERLYDATAPGGYVIRFTVSEVNVSNQTHVSLEVTGAEVGANYTYRINSDNGGGEVTGTAIVSSSSFTIPDLDLSGLADGLLTVRLHLIDAQGNKGESVTSQVEKLTKNIAAVSDLPGIRVPFKTKFNKVPLPDKVEVTFTNGDKEDLKVKWDEGSYNETVAAIYVLTGQLQLKEKMSNTNNLMARITVEVEANQVPTAINLSNHTFEPDINPGEAIGYFSTEDPDDEEFTYTLVSGQGDAHNQFFKLDNNHQLHLKTNQGLSGMDSFTIRIKSEDPYGNAIEQTFTLTKALYQPEDKIKLVNAFSPDGDGINDFWIVPELHYYNQVEVEVFNRAGVRLFHSSNPEEGWDGRGENGSISAGSYFYIIQVKDINLVQKGVVTILK